MKYSGQDLYLQDRLVYSCHSIDTGPTLTTCCQVISYHVLLLAAGSESRVRNQQLYQEISFVTLTFIAPLKHQPLAPLHFFLPLPINILSTRKCMHTHVRLFEYTYLPLYLYLYIYNIHASIHWNISNNMCNSHLLSAIFTEFLLPDYHKPSIHRCT